MSDLPSPAAPPAMAAKKSADQWFADYGGSHCHHANEVIHWFCVPVIFASILGFVWTIPIPAAWPEAIPWFSWVLVAMAVVMPFYVRLSPALGAGMFFFMSLCYTGIVLLEMWAPWPVGKICAITFVLAWGGQFVGHLIEGRKPSFFQDLVFLLIGPAWLLSKVYRQLGQKY